MKRQDFNQRVDQKWSWPRKTWLQQRLEAVKAEKRGERQQEESPDEPAVRNAEDKKNSEE